MENGDLPKIAQVAEPLIELELYLSFPFSNHWTVCVGSSCAGPQLHLWENKWRRARIVFYIKWPNLGRDEIAARTGPKWIAVLAFNTILSLFLIDYCIFSACAFSEGEPCRWAPSEAAASGVRWLCLERLYQRFSDTRPCSAVTGGVQPFPPADCAWEAPQCSPQEGFILHL